jgi:hypothetical protein
MHGAGHEYAMVTLVGYSYIFNTTQHHNRVCIFGNGLGPPFSQPSLSGTVLDKLRSRCLSISSVFNRSSPKSISFSSIHGSNPVLLGSVSDIGLICPEWGLVLARD